MSGLSPSRASGAGLPDASAGDRLAELERRIAELEPCVAELERVKEHREWRISELETHIANIEALRARTEERVGELQRHAGNLEGENAELKAHAANLDELVSSARHRIRELERHAGNLEERLREREMHLAAVDRHAKNLEQVVARAGDRLVAGYHSRFGGLWPDRIDAPERLEQRLAAGEIREEQAEQLRHWMENGFVVLPRAVPDRLIDKLNAAVDRLYQRGDSRIYVDTFEDGERFRGPIQRHHREGFVKVLDLHARLEPARRVIFSPPVREFLELVFERRALAFQTLYFDRGSRQPMHQDAVYVGVKSPLQFAAAWVALEDIEEGSGELEYYVGSHRLEDYVWDGRYKLMPIGHPDHQAYLDSLHAQAAERGLERRRFRGRKGDVLIWHPDLAHGGAPPTRRESTRRSIVAHYCPVDLEPVYFNDESAHSRKLTHASGAYYCFEYHWARASR